MLLPILYQVAEENPEHEFTLLTQPFFANLLLSPPDNLEAMVIDTKGEERHIWGLLRYIERLVEEQFDIYIDAHDVLRTKMTRWCLGLRGVKTYHLRKPRHERSLLVKHRQGQALVSVPPMHQLYKELFRSAGLHLKGTTPIIKLEEGLQHPLLKQEYPEAFDENIIIGIAPFASTISKTYDLSLMEEVVQTLSQAGLHVYLFGGRGKEAEVLDTWEERYPKVHSLAGKLDLSDELTLMNKIKLLVSMDSANMHLASMLGIQVLSVWCATHPSAGFLGIGQSLADCLQSDTLGCRPCSIFGKVDKCIHQNMPCRQGISPEQICKHVFKYITTPK